MPRFVRISKEVIHIPSLANVSMGTTCLGGPFLCFHYHNQKSQTIGYSWGKWDQCEKDLIRVKAAMIEIEKILDSVSLIDEVKEQNSKQDSKQESLSESKIVVGIQSQ
jgi:hypothetical protein